LLERLLDRRQPPGAGRAAARAARYHARNFDSAADKERADLRELERSRQADLTAKGMVFNQLDAVQFRAALVKAGFYGQWQKT
jgi:TRAP-type C4-dicarboxylate transport system substrate-binding protein